MGSGRVGDAGQSGLDAEAALCGVLVSPQKSRFATGNAMTFIKEKMKTLGAPDPKIITVDRKRFIREE
jgi:hypothetical protein